MQFDLKYIAKEVSRLNTEIQWLSSDLRKTFFRDV